MNTTKKSLSNGLLTGSLLLVVISAYAQYPSEGTAGHPYPNMPVIAPIGERIGKYLEVNESAKGPDIDAGKGYRLQKLGNNLFMITDNAYQSMFMIYEAGVVVVDAPPPFAQHIVKAIREVTDKSITHLIYTHSHIDHIGGTKSLNLKKDVIIIAHDETSRLLKRAMGPIVRYQPSLLKRSIR
jgi:hypothetical protein